MPPCPAPTTWRTAWRTVANGSRRAAGLLPLAVALSAVLPADADAQRTPNPPTVLQLPNLGMLLERVSADTPLSCTLQRGDEPQLARQGIVTRYYFQLPFTARHGTLGLDATGRPRFLLVTIDLRGHPYQELHSATASFAENGALLVGRRATRLIGEGAPPEAVGGLSAQDAAAMLQLARDLTARCVSQR